MERMSRKPNHITCFCVLLVLEMQLSAMIQHCIEQKSSWARSSLPCIKNALSSPYTTRKRGRKKVESHSVLILGRSGRRAEVQLF
ncbi:hypothetical protein GYMLUDRAFT_830138 [Collybiopsis luxurians FD-317 M1]|uniref:Secreted protein n=1 Tax=Collybiopsis luxurians FD-317 M1 TaxID=944289 RepID=A0A0D0CL51_9AGAR|nr:hypothetical protein GYMLUDRAFT_830138 [Collybiopsis luxurians FD-317 M1]